MVLFAKVIEKSSFTQAALELGISKSLISKKITNLENHLGVRLLNRTTRRLKLTEAGEIFHQHCLRVVAAAKEAESAVMPLQIEPKGVLYISAPQSLAISLLPKAILEFQARYPEIELDVRISGHFVDLVKEGIDVALRIGKLVDSTLKAKRLCSCYFEVCAAPKYWLTHGRPKNPSELSNYNCLIYTQSERGNHNHWQFVKSPNKKFSVTVKGKMKVDDGYMMLNAALAGMGVIYSPSIMLKPYIEAGQLESVLTQFSSDANGLYAIYPYGQYVSPKVRVFIDFLAQAWKNV